MEDRAEQKRKILEQLILELDESKLDFMLEIMLKIELPKTKQKSNSSLSE